MPPWLRKSSGSTISPDPVKLLAALFLAASLSPAEYQFKTSDGASLRVVDEGKGRALVLVPGWTMGADIWRPQFRRYRKKYRVVSFDPRGQGGSKAEGKAQSTARRAKDIEELILHCRLKDPVLLGWSMGGLEVMHLLAKSPAAIRAVVFVDQGLDKGCWPGPSGGTKLADDIKAGPYAKVVREFVADMFKTRRSRRELEALTHHSLKTSQKTALAALQSASSGEGLRSALARRPLPALSMVTSRLFKESDCLEEALPSLRVERFEKAGHALFLDEPGRFHLVLDHFLKSLR